MACETCTALRHSLELTQQRDHWHQAMLYQAWKTMAGQTRGLQRQRRLIKRLQRELVGRNDLLQACKAAEEWLSGWASAEPFLPIIRAAITKANGDTA